MARLCERLEIKYSGDKFNKLMLKLNPEYNVEANDNITFDMFLQFAKKSQLKRSKKILKRGAMAAVASVSSTNPEGQSSRSEYSASVSAASVSPGQPSPPGYTG